MNRAEIQELCELGQRQLTEMRYLEAEATLAGAEQSAWESADWDSLARLYLPLQETRRQRRQRCGEGIVCLDLIAQSSDDVIQGIRVLENFPHGQLLVGGWGTIAPASDVRVIGAEHGLYVETFLAAVYPLIEQAQVVVIVASEDAVLPAPTPRTAEELTQNLPLGSLFLDRQSLPAGSRRGNAQTYGHNLALWERLHAPFLAAADSETDPIRKMQGYRKTIQVDYGCELAHQNLAAVARQLSRIPGASVPAAGQ